MSEELLPIEPPQDPPVESPTENHTPEEMPWASELASLRSELSALREELAARQKADEINRRNASCSAGRAGTNTAPEYFSPEEVRAMSAHEVRENYQRIRASMKRWH